MAVVHVCFSCNAKENLEVAIKNKIIKGENVIALYDDLSVGPVFNIQHMSKRLKWWKDFLPQYGSEDIEELRENYNKFYKKLLAFDYNTTIYFWYGNNAMELCGLMYTLRNFAFNINKCYIIDVSKKIYNKSQYNIRAVSEIESKKIKDFLEYKTILKSEEYKNFLSNWQQLTGEKSNFRIYRNNKVENVDEDYFDNIILNSVTTDFKKVIVIIGEVLAKSDVFVRDYYIFWRIRELIKKGKLKFNGSILDGNNLEIKI